LLKVIDMTELSSWHVWMSEMEAGLSAIYAAMSVKFFTDIESKRLALRVCLTLKM